MYELALESNKSEVSSYVPYDDAVDAFNSRSRRQLFITCRQPTLNERRSNAYFATIDSLSALIGDVHNLPSVQSALMVRAVAYSSLQNFESAIDDLSTYLQMDSLSAIALWQRAVCKTKNNAFIDAQAAQSAQTAPHTTHTTATAVTVAAGTGTLKTVNVMDDLNKAIAIAPSCAYLYYNRANVSAADKDYRQAINDYTKAIDLDARLAEAYYNRGMALIDSGNTTEGIADLSKAGELGLYTAYSLIKKYRK